jgi:hypothetical protein
MSIMINDRYCWNCGHAEHNCDSYRKEDINGFCFGWTPVYPDDETDETNDDEFIKHIE